MPKDLSKAIMYFGAAGVALLITVVRLFLGYIPSSRIVQYGNITSQGNPVSFWITIALLAIAAFVFFLLGAKATIQYLQEK